MKLIFAFLVALASFCASADTNVLVNGYVVTTGTPNLYAGAGTGRSIAIGCAPAQAAAAKAVGAPTPYTCKTAMAVAPQAKQPADKQQLAACPSGTTGTYPQRQTSTFDLATNSWPFTGTWLPAAAPAGVCTPVVVAPPPSTTPTTGIITPMGFMPAIDLVKIPPRNAADVRFVPRRVPTAETVNTASDMGAFRLGCWYSHFGFYDPLVNPGNEGPDKFHLHVFFGNAGINKDSTSDLLATTGGSTCSGGTLNRSSYWAPAMIDTTDGSAIAPSALLVYYKSGYGGVKLSDIQPVPKGLHMISGATNGTSEATAQGGRFSCVGGANGVGWQKSIPANCYQDNSLVMEVVFPQCWDGVNLDSADHKAHMAEATGNGCPVTHPVAIAAISFEIYYDLAKVDLSRMAKWRLSNDNYALTSPGGYGAHADYMFAWDADTIAAITKNCNNVPTDCHANLVGDGTKLLAPSDPDPK